ncbi:MAG: hypothetical protein ACJ8H8_03875 [Geminicoccaceae bacterium]
MADRYDFARLDIANPAAPALIEAGKVHAELQGIFRRPMFVCGCGVRTTTLYAGDEGDDWICAACRGVKPPPRPSRADSLDPHQRAVALRKRIGASPVLFTDLAPRPRGMSQVRYDRIIERIRRYETKALMSNGAFLAFLRKITGQDQADA